MKKIFVTGGAGFIGSALVKKLLTFEEYQVINIDKLTYAGDLKSLESIRLHKNYFFEKIDICDRHSLHKLFFKYKPDLIIHLAAESHVDKSIDGPEQFIKTNIYGTYNLLEESRQYFNQCNKQNQSIFRFYHVSTDEVYGDLGLEDGYFNESSPYKPSSPYSASKASSDHLVRAWYRTYNLPIIISNCSNNYGPFQYPEKLIPTVILNALNKTPIPIYGDGNQIRDWLYVDDHVNAIIKISEEGELGETYNIGGNNEIKNIDICKKICTYLDNIIPINDHSIKSYKDLITFVSDRAGHDIRYAIDSSKLNNSLGWSPTETFDSGVIKTINWYLTNIDWCSRKSQIDFNSLSG